MKKSVLRKTVASSKVLIADAEAQLAKLIKVLDAAPRAQKTTVSRVLSEAISRLNAARAELEALESIDSLE